MPWSGVVLPGALSLMRDTLSPVCDGGRAHSLIGSATKFVLSRGPTPLGITYSTLNPPTTAFRSAQCRG